MLIQTILNKLEKFKSFIYKQVSFKKLLFTSSEVLVVEIAARKNSRGECSECGKPCSAYDRQPTRYYEYVPLWAIQVYFAYAPRRVKCREHGIHVEQVPWASGKQHMTKTYQLFLARWAKRLSWKEVAVVFQTSWESVYRSIEWVVNYGLVHADWSGIKQIGVDEMAFFKGHKYMTCVYQLDKGRRRLLWCGKDRTAKTLLRFFRKLGKEGCADLRFVCSDMWAPYLLVIKKKAINALNILDRFHIMKKFNEAIDEVRRQEVKQLKEEEQDNVLANGRWLLLKKAKNLTEKQTARLKELLKINLSSVKAYLMREDFQQFWEMGFAFWGNKFLEDWATRAMHSNLEPMKKLAKMLRRHKDLILNWFSSDGLSSGPVEGLNNKAKLTVRKAYGFKTLKCLQIALYHQLGDLNEPLWTHRFC